LPGAPHRPVGVAAIQRAVAGDDLVVERRVAARPLADVVVGDLAGVEIPRVAEVAAVVDEQAAGRPGTVVVGVGVVTLDDHAGIGEAVLVGVGATAGPAGHGGGGNR